jgi:Protein of unknown function (DUF2852)
MGLVFMILGFIWWWPLGLIILAALIASGRIGYRRRLQFAGSPTSGWGHITRMDPANRVPTRDRARGNWWAQSSSGNRAFDDYRAETLRRLEDEQREFKEFLKRLRVARDRAEFDLFMNERHNRLADQSLAPRASVVATDIQGKVLSNDLKSP